MKVSNIKKKKKTLYIQVDQLVICGSKNLNQAKKTQKFLKLD